MMKSEVVFSNQDGPEDKFAWYVQPIFKLNPRLEPFFRMDYFDNGTESGTKTEFIIGVNYFPVNTLRLRGEYILHQYKQDKDDGGRNRNFSGLVFTAIVPF
jgi:hypothetical protein